ncbi:penicillin-binding protein 2 [bacterium]|nr:penicillin-binding protein 2 [bacterium]
MYVKNLRLMLGLFAICMVILFSRLIYMQIFSNQFYESRADKNMRLNFPLKARRGMIFDRCGRVLARNKSIFALHFLSYKFSDPEGEFRKLAEFLQIPEAKINKVALEIKKNPQEEALILENFDDVTLAKFVEISDKGGCRLEETALRVYPYGKNGAHILGYVGEIDGEELKKREDQGYVIGDTIGKDGVELSHENILHGRSGWRTESVNILGEATGSVNEEQAVAGRDIYLSIDMELQKYTEEVLRDILNRLAYKNGERSGGAVVAIETDTGFVRAMASLPNYDPNEFVRGISTDRFNKLINDPCAPLLNRSVHSAYPPGSTFKLVTTSACLQEKIISPHSSFYCEGKYEVAGLPFFCFVRTGHGPLNLTECLGYSCDAVYYEIGPKLGIDRLKKYANAFGLGEKTGIDLPGENSGQIPTKDWKFKNFEEKWFPGDDANSAIGQGFVTASPLQMAMVAQAVANGGKVYKPQLLERIGKDNGGTLKDAVVRKPILLRQLPIDTEFFQDIARGTRAAVEYGTAAKSACFYIGAAGKTGTAENSPTEDNPRGLNHCWFVGFAPYANIDDWKAPGLTVAVCLEKSGGYGGEIAAPVAAQVLSKWNSMYTSKKNNP